jgi:protein-disulfide isomerase
MFCVISFIVLSILGVFSAENRSLAREALDCVLRRVTLRPCNTGFDEKMKAKILGFVITKTETGARILNRFFEPLSWIFVLLFLGSAFFAVRGVYLFYVTGSCNGLNQSGFCVFDPTGQSNQISNVGESCPVVLPGEDPVSLKGVNLDGFPVLNEEGEKSIVFIGSYGCEYSRKAYPVVRQLAEKNAAKFTFLYYPVKESSDFLAKVGYCAYRQDAEKYWSLVDTFFTAERSQIEDESFIRQTLSEAGYNADAILFCAGDPQTEWAVKKQLSEVVKTRFFGTPTVFIQNEVLIGPKPPRVYAIALNGLLYWAR